MTNVSDCFLKQFNKIAGCYDMGLAVQPNLELNIRTSTGETIQDEDGNYQPVAPTFQKYLAHVYEKKPPDHMVKAGVDVNSNYYEGRLNINSFLATFPQECEAVLTTNGFTYSGVFRFLFSDVDAIKEEFQEYKTLGQCLRGYFLRKEN